MMKIMGNNIFRILFLSILSAWILASCSNETALESQTGDISLKISSGKNSTRSSVDPGTEEESELKSVKVWLFESAATDDDKCLLYSDLTVASGTTETTVTFTEAELNKKKVNPNGEYIIYTVANTPDDVTTLDETIRLGVLKKFVYTTSYDLEAGTDGRPLTPLLMSGVLKHNFKGGKRAEITLVRVAVKLNFSLTDSTGSGLKLPCSVTVNNDLRNVGVISSLIAAGTPFTTDQPLEFSIKDKMAVYINEHVNTETPVFVTITGSDTAGNEYTWTFPIEFGGSLTLLRNTAYNINVKLKPYSAETKVSVIAWDEVIQDDDQELDTPNP